MENGAIMKGFHIESAPTREETSHRESQKTLLGTVRRRRGLRGDLTPEMEKTSQQ